MEWSRRTVLAATGVGATGALGAGYWQRRRLARVSDIRALRATTEIAVPQFEADPVITPSLLEGAYDQARSRFDEIEPRLDPPFERYSEAMVEDLRTDLTDTAPDRVTVRPNGPPAMHYARRQALSTYRRNPSRVVRILAHESPEKLPADSFDERSSAVDERIDAVTIQYRGETLGEAIVAGSTIESAVVTAESRLENATEEDARATQWEHLERATAAIADVESFIEAQDGGDYDEDLPAVAEQLRDEYNDRREDAPDFVDENGEEPVSSFAIGAVGMLHRPMRRLGAVPDVRGRLLDNDSWYGRAAHTFALLLPTIPLYDAFADIPHTPFWDDREYRVEATNEEIRAEKQATVDAVDPYLETDNPLVSHLAAVPLGAVRDTDNRLERMIADARTLTDDEWAFRRDRALFRYEAARRYAEAIDETIDILDDAQP